MGASERRRAIISLLCRRRGEIIKNIAAEFGVSERTIRRDIEALSITEPIYTKAGRYGGGVYVMDGYDVGKMYLNNVQSAVLKKVLHYAQTNQICNLSHEEMTALQKIVSEHTAIYS